VLHGAYSPTIVAEAEDETVRMPRTRWPRSSAADEATLVDSTISGLDTATPEPDWSVTGVVAPLKMNTWLQ